MYTRPLNLVQPSNKTIIFTGGLNESRSNLEMKAGECYDLVNYEEINGEFHGYRSTPGFEKIDGYNKWIIEPFYPPFSTVINNGDFSVPADWNGAIPDVFDLTGTGDIVSVAYYDTNNDTDPTWRFNQDASWYQETLNTATRGSRREFPGKAVIIAKDDRVTIYDLTTATPEMWMVFNQTVSPDGNYSFWRGSRPCTSVDMAEGILTFGIYSLGGGISNVAGVAIANFKTDDLSRITVNSLYGGSGLTVSERNDNTDLPVQGTPAPLVDPRVNDVTIRYNSTLSRPVIAVATDGGVSVIDGPAGVDTVVDSSDTDSMSLVVFDELLNLRAVSSNTTWIYDTYTSDGFSAGWTYNAAGTASTGISYPNGVSFITSADNTVCGNAFGLSVLKEDITTPANGMVAYVTDEYNTGFMQGDIKLGTLMDSTEETLGTDVTTEFVTQGTLDDTEGWSGIGWSIANGLASYDGTDALNLLGQDVLTIGRYYTVSIDINSRTQGSIGLTDGVQVIADSILSTGVHSYTFQAQGTTLSIRPEKFSTLRFIGDIGKIEVVDLGTRLETNGDFDTDLSGWTDLSTGTGTATWDVLGAKLTRDSDSSNRGIISQTIPTVIGQTYEITYSVDAATTGNVLITFGGASVNILAGGNTGLFTFKADSTSESISFYPTTDSSVVYINSVSILPVPSLVDNGTFRTDRAWTKGPGWSISGGVAAYDGTNAANAIAQASVLEVGKKYLIGLDIVGATAGNDKIAVISAETSDLAFTGNGSHSGTFTASITSLSIYAAFAAGRFDGSIDNVSVYELELVNGTWQIKDQIVVNPSFDGVLDEAWVDLSTGSGSVTAEGGSIRLVGTSSADRAIISQGIATEIGEIYTVTLDRTINSGTIYAGYGNSASFNPVVTVGTTNPTFTFKASAATTYIYIWSTGSGGDGTADNVSVKRLQSLIENGEFSYDLKWTKGTGWTISSGVASCDGTQTANSILYQGSFLSGKYLVTYDYSLTAGTLRARFGGTDTGQLISTPGSGTITEVIECTVDTNIFAMVANLDFIGTVDNISVYPLEIEDRSVNDNPLQVVGQVIKTPVATGADLVSFGNFNTEDFIEQPYNSALDPGTGDYYRMGWVKHDYVSGLKTVMDRRNSLSNMFDDLFFFNNNKLTYRTTGAAGGILTSTTVVGDDQWHFFCVWRAGGVLNIAIDGNSSEDSTANAHNVTSDQSLRVGVSHGGFPLINGSIALLRHGNSTITEAQIQEIYAQEAPLFQSNAQCLLPATAVTAVSHNESTGETKVATGTTISTFDGLLKTSEESRSWSVTSLDSQLTALADGGSTGWGIYTGGDLWVLDGNDATYSSTSGQFNELRQDGVLEIGKAYQLTFDVDVTQGELFVYAGKVVTVVDSTATYTLSFVANSTDLIFEGSNDFLGSIDNVSVTEDFNYLGDGEFTALEGYTWTVGLGWSVTGGEAVAVTASSNLTHNESGLLDTSAEYIIEFEITAVSGGTIKFQDVGTERSTLGVYQERLTPSSDVFYLTASNFSGAVDNIKVYKVTDMLQAQYPSDVPLVWLDETTVIDTAREDRRAEINAPDLTGGGYLKGAFDYDGEYFVIGRDNTGGAHRLFQMTSENDTGWTEITSFPTINEVTDSGVNYHVEIGRFETYPLVTDGATPNTDVAIMCNGISPAIIMYKKNDGTYTCISLEEANGPDYSVDYTVRLPSDPSIAEGYPIRSIVYNQRLHIAFPYGTLFVSHVGDPFWYDNSLKSAGVWWLGSEITDMVIAPSALVVFMDKGIDTIRPSDPDMITGFDEIKETFSPTSGAKPNSAQRILGRTIFCDDRGITTLETVDRYGDFSVADLSKKIKKTYADNKDNIIGTAVDRINDQYIIYFGNGEGIVLTLELNYRGDFQTRGATKFSLGKVFNYVWGVRKQSKRLLINGSSGHLYMQHSPAQSFDGSEISSRFTTSFHPYGSITNWKSFTRLLIELQAQSGQTFNIRPIFDYQGPEVPKAAVYTTDPTSTASIWGQGIWGSFVWGGTGAVNQEYSYINGVGVNMSIQFSHSSKYHSPHVVQNAIVVFNRGGIKY